MKYINFFILLLIPIFISGCYNPQELDDLAYVIGIGADIAENDEINITYQIAIPVKIGGEDSSTTGNDTYTTYTIQAKSLYEGNSKVDSITSKEVTLSHLKVIVYSEELAKKDLSGHINSLINNVEIRPRTYVVVCKGKAADFLNDLNPKLESSPARFYDLVLSSYEYSSEIAESSLIEFYTNCESIDKDAFAILANAQPEKSVINSNSSGDQLEPSAQENSSDNSGNSKGNNETADSSDSSGDSSNNEQTIFNGIALFSRRKNGL